MDKKALRKEIREKIRDMDPEYREKSDAGIFENLIGLPEYKKAGAIFAYFSINGEADTHHIIRYSLERGKKVALPVILGEGTMTFALAEGKMISGALYRIPEPDAGAQRIAPKPGDLIIVPALCFDSGGYRLGQGGGFYDRFLEKYAGVFAVGLCREALFLDEVPRERHDMAVRCVVTEKRTARP
ncbi:MAG: 5-formyltetrahydrofolate cyclo-ligase [Oscillospiraceae bacterium]